MEQIAQETVRSMPAGDPKQAAIAEREANAARKKAEEIRKREAKEQKLTEQRMAALDKKSPESKAAKKTPEQLEAQMTLDLHKIRLYYEKLSHKLSSKAPKQMPRTPEGARQLREAIECELQSTGGIETAGALYMTSLQVLEHVTTHVWNPLNLQLSGPRVSLSAAAQQNSAALNDLVTEFAIGHSEYFMAGPLRRLVQFTLTLAVQVDQINKGTAAAPVPPEVAKEAEQLAETL